MDGDNDEVPKLAEPSEGASPEGSVPTVPDSAPVQERPPESFWDDVLNREFAGETDRAAVIVGAALLDDALDTLLRARLAPIVSGEDSLFDGAYAPVANFSARIDLAYRIGVVSAKMTRDLHLVRKVRNSFAHDITGCSFEDASVRSRVLELMRSHGYADRFPGTRALFPKGPRGDFQLSVSLMQWALRSKLRYVAAVEPMSAEFPYTARPPSPEDDAAAV